MNPLLKAENVAPKIYWIRGHRVMLDKDLAALYQVETKYVNLAVRRNRARFPDDFMFQLTDQESENLRLQIATSSWGGRRYQMFVFTQEGVAMLSSVLRSERAALVNIAIMRAFVWTREVLSGHKDLLLRLEKMEHRLVKHGRKIRGNHREIRQIFEVIQALLAPPLDTHPPIGFRK